MAPAYALTITYNGNGSDGGLTPTDTTDYSNGAVVVLAGNTLTRTGFNFTGWNTAANGSGSLFAPGGFFTINSDTTLFAQWTPAGGGGGGGGGGVGPVLTPGGGAIPTFTSGGSAVAIDSGIAVADINSPTLVGVSLSISPGTFVAGDQLNFTNQNGITGAYDGATGILTLSGPALLATYQTALRSVTFSSSAGDATNGGARTSRQIGFSANDNVNPPSLPVLATLNVAAAAAPAATVSSTTVPANGTYKLGQNLDFTVTYSRAITVNTAGGTPYLPVTLDTGGTVNAAYVSGSGTATLTFRYTVAAGNLDASGIAVASAITLNGGTMVDGDANNAPATGLAFGSTAAVRVDGVAPVVIAVSLPANGGYVASQTLTFTINWSEAVTVTGTPNLALTIGSTAVQAAYVSGSGTTALVFCYTVQNGDSDPDGIAVGALSLNGGTIADAAGNNATLALNSIGSTTAVLVGAAPPTLTTPQAGGVTTTGAVLFATLSSAGTPAATTFGLVFAPTATNNNPRIGGPGVQDVTATLSGSQAGSLVNGLTASTSYSFAVYATNAAGTSYSPAGTFTTLTPPPVAVSLTLGNLTATYDGTPKRVSVTSSPAVSTQVTYTRDGVGVLAPTEVGTYRVSVSVSQLGYTGTTSGSLTIAPRPLTVTGIVVKDKLYDGKTTATLDLSKAVLAGLVAADVGRITLDASKATGTFTTADIGTGKTVTITGLSLSGTGASNYSLPSSVTTTGNITGAATTIAASGTFTVKAKPSTTFLSLPGLYPVGLAFDSSDNLYIGINGTQGASAPQNSILKVTPAGTSSTFVPTSAGLSGPVDLAFDKAGNLYVANNERSIINKVTPGGVMSTFASGFTGGVLSLAFDSTGNLYASVGANSYVAHKIVKVAPNGTVSPVLAATRLIAGLTFDALGNLYTTSFDDGKIVKVAPDGTQSTYAAIGALAFHSAFDTVGNLFVGSNDKVVVVTPDGKVSNFLSGLSAATGLAFNKAGDLFVAAEGGIVKVTPVNTVALRAKVASTLGTVNAGTVTFTLLDTNNNVVGTPVTSGTLTEGTVSVNYPIPATSGPAPYTIKAVYNAAGPFTTSTDASQTLSPTFLQAFAILFGRFNNTVSLAGVAERGSPRARAASVPDTIGVVLNPDGTTGKIVGTISSLNAGFAVDITLHDDNTFSGQTQVLTSSTGTGRTLTFSGSIADGVMTGTVAELGLSFTAEADPARGSSAASAGLYRAASPVPGGGTAYTLVGTQGQVFAIAITPSGVTAGTGTLSASGAYSISTPQGATIAGAVDNANQTTTATITQPGGAKISVFGASSAVVPVHQLANLSILGSAGGGQTITAGFVVQGPGMKNLLARAIGPTLSSFGVTPVQSTPALTVFDGKGKPLASNSDWGGDSTLAAAFDQVGAFRLSATSRDAAVIANLPPGAYTLQVTGAGATGRALAELYDLDQDGLGRAVNLINVSSLGPVTGSATPLVAGFQVQGNSPQTVLIRGIGPSLTAFGVGNALATPLLQVFDRSSTLIAQNQKWGTPVTVGANAPAASATDIAAAAGTAGAFPLASGSSDAAVLMTLTPGTYTVQLAGANNAAGTGLIEVYGLK